MAKTVGVVGLGIMGGAMSMNLAKSGWRVLGFDPSDEARAALRRNRGTPLRSAAEVARAAPIVITSLPSAGALIAVAEEIAASGARTGRIVVETSTLPIDVKTRARDMLARAGVTLLDCPLSGTGAQARVRDLSVYASGPIAAYKKCIPIFKGFGRSHYHVGAFGAGSKMKFVANHLVAIHNVAAAEAMVLGIKAGLDPQLVYDVISDGAGSSRMFQVRGPMMVANDYSDATMKVEVWQKDMAIIGQFATALDCPVPLFALTAPIYNAAMAQGYAREDTGSVCAVLGAMARVRRKRASSRTVKKGRR
jgi:L-threonate 2-dehydrogenase